MRSDTKLNLIIEEIGGEVSKKICNKRWRTQRRTMNKGEKKRDNLCTVAHVKPTKVLLELRNVITETPLIINEVIKAPPHTHYEFVYQYNLISFSVCETSNDEGFILFYLFLLMYCDILRFYKLGLKFSC